MASAVWSWCADCRCWSCARSSADTQRLTVAVAALWIGAHIREAQAVLASAMARRQPGPFQIKAAIAASQIGGDTKRAILDPYNPTGSTSYVNFPTTKDTLWKTDPRKCHVNFVVCDSDWEAEFCRVAEAHPRVISYVKNQSLGFEVPYVLGAARHRYLPDFIVRIDDGRPDPLNLVVEIKGYRGEDAKVKAETMRAYWVPGVNRLGTHGRWDFVEFRSVYEIQADFDKLIAGFLAPVPA